MPGGPRSGSVRGVRGREGVCGGGPRLWEGVANEKAAWARVPSLLDRYLISGQGGSCVWVSGMEKQGMGAYRLRLRRPISAYFKPVQKGTKNSVVRDTEMQYTGVQ